MSNEELVDQIRHGFSVTSNMERLYTQNLPLLRQFIKPYLSYESKEDLLQESYIGLWQAVQHYESSENVRFMTFAQFWVKSQIQRYTEDCASIIRLPSHLRQQIMRYKKTVQRLQQELGRKPTDEEISEYMRISPDRVRKLQLCMHDVASLDAPLSTDSSDDKDYTLADTIQGDCNVEDDVISELYAEYQKSELWSILARFTDESQQELLRRYASGRSLAQIARETGENYSAVRREFNAVMRKLNTGRPRRILRQEFEMLDARLYNNSFKRFKERGCNVENIAIQRAELKS